MGPRQSRWHVCGYYLKGIVTMTTSMDLNIGQIWSGPMEVDREPSGKLSKTEELDTKFRETVKEQTKQARRLMSGMIRHCGDASAISGGDSSGDITQMMRLMMDTMQLEQSARNDATIQDNSRQIDAMRRLTEASVASQLVDRHIRVASNQVETKEEGQKVKAYHDMTSKAKMATMVVRDGKNQVVRLQPIQPVVGENIEITWDGKRMVKDAEGGISLEAAPAGTYKIDIVAYGMDDKEVPVPVYTTQPVQSVNFMDDGSATVRVAGTTLTLDQVKMLHAAKGASD